MMVIFSIGFTTYFIGLLGAAFCAVFDSDTYADVASRLMFGGLALMIGVFLIGIWTQILTNL